MDYSGYPEYPQLHPPFDHAVTVLDLIFNVGPDAPRYMKSFQREARRRPRVKPLVIFGAGELARLAYLAFTAAPEHEVVACTVSREFVDETELFGLPVVPWEELETTHPPERPRALRRGRVPRRQPAPPRALRGSADVEATSSRATSARTRSSPTTWRSRENTFVFEGAIVQPFATLGQERDRVERRGRRARLADRRQLLHRAARGDRRQRARRRELLRRRQRDDPRRRLDRARLRDRRGRRRQARHEARARCTRRRRRPVSDRRSSELDRL